MYLKAEAPNIMKAKYILFLEHILCGFIMYVNAAIPSKMKAKTYWSRTYSICNYNIFNGRSPKQVECKVHILSGTYSIRNYNVFKHRIPMQDESKEHISSGTYIIWNFKVIKSRGPKMKQRTDGWNNWAINLLCMCGDVMDCGLEWEILITLEIVAIHQIRMTKRHEYCCCCYTTCSAPLTWMAYESRDNDLQFIIWSWSCIFHLLLYGICWHL